MEAELRVCMELLAGYEPTTGRLWRLDAEGRPVRELQTWREREEEGRLAVMPVHVGQKRYRPATHVIWRVMSGDWPETDQVVDHVSGDVTDTRWRNLRLATVGQNNLNRDMSARRLNGIDEKLETGVSKRATGYQVCLRGQCYGTFRKRERANEVARDVRKRLNGEFDKGHFLRRI